MPTNPGSRPDRTRQILGDLEAVRENLLALSDDIWLSIDHNDPQALIEAVRKCETEGSVGTQRHCEAQ